MLLLNDAILTTNINKTQNQIHFFSSPTILYVSNMYTMIIIEIYIMLFSFLSLLLLSLLLDTISSISSDHNFYHFLLL